MNANLERLSENSVKLTVEVSAEEFDKALEIYNNRNRRFGGN